MLLPGQLSSTTLGDLLGALFRGRCTGTLELVDSFRAASHRLGLEQGLLGNIQSPLRVTPLGELLREEGLLGQGGWLSFVAALRARPDRQSGHILIEERLVAPHELRRVLARQRRERLERLFALEEAAIRFRVGRLHTDRYAPPVLGPRDFLFGRPRARQRETKPNGLCENRHSDERDQALSLLGVSEGAAPQEIQGAFRSLARTLHPDRAAGRDVAEQVAATRAFARLTAAYHSLMKG